MTIWPEYVWFFLVLAGSAFGWWARGKVEEMLEEDSDNANE